MCSISSSYLHGIPEHPYLTVCADLYFFLYSSAYHARLMPYSQDKEKSVRFDDILDDQAPGQIGQIRRKLKQEQLRGRNRSQVKNY